MFNRYGQKFEPYCEELSETPPAPRKQSLEQEWREDDDHQRYRDLMS